MAFVSYPIGYVPCPVCNAKYGKPCVDIRKSPSRPDYEKGAPHPGRRYDSSYLKGRM